MSHKHDFILSALNNFSCLGGTPTPKVRWIGPDGYSLPMDTLDAGDGFLEITNARKFEHEGEYKCQSANLAGMVSVRTLVRYSNRMFNLG